MELVMTRSPKGCENDFSIMERDTETHGLAPKNRHHDMENFIKSMEPVIKAIIRRYRPNIRSFEFEDLMQEGYATALAAAKIWKAQPGKARLIPWIWLLIKLKFNKLSKKSIPNEVFFEDLDMEIAWEEAYFAEPVDDRDADEDREKIIQILIRTLPKYRDYLEAVLDESLVNVSAAKNLGVSKQLVTQLQKEVRNSLMGDHVK